MRNKKIIVLLIISVLISGVLPMTLGASASDQQTVLVTGANRGIGLEFARQFKKLGYSVIATARKPEQANALKDLGVQIEQLDVTDPKSVQALAGTLKETQIDILINNAGVIGDPKATLASLDFDRMSSTFEVNTLGPMRVAQALHKNMRDSDQKKIIQISSTLGSIENNNGGYYDYRASKAALNMLNKSLASELSSDGFICVVLHPGWVQTDLGGANAAITTEVSVSGMVKVIDKLDSDDNAHFFDYQGQELPW